MKIANITQYINAATSKAADEVSADRQPVGRSEGRFSGIKRVGNSPAGLPQPSATTPTGRVPSKVRKERVGDYLKNQLAATADKTGQLGKKTARRVHGSRSGPEQLTLKKPRG